MLKRLLTFCAFAVMSLGTFAAVVEDFKKDWTVEESYPYYKVDGKATFEIEDGALKITYPVGDDGAQAWSQYFIGDWMNLTEGYTYTIKFYAKAAEACTVDVHLGSWGSAGKATGVAIGTEWAEISCTVKDGVPTSSNNDLHVLIQGGRGPIYYKWVTVSHDDSEEVVKEPEPEPWVCPEGEVDITTLPWVNNGQPCTKDFGKNKGAVFGTDAGGDNLSYVDITDYKAIKIYGEPSGVRAFINRSEFSSGIWQFNVTIGDDGVAVINTADVLAAQAGAEYVHLNGIKAGPSYDSQCTVFGISVVPADPELTINGNYSEDYSSWTGNIIPTNDANTLYYTIDGGADDPEFQLVEGPITVAWLESLVEVGNVCKYVIVVKEVDAEGNVVAQAVEEVSLAKPAPAIDVVINYNGDNSQCKLFAHPSEEGNMVVYAFDEKPEVYEGEVPETGLELAYTPGKVDELGVCKMIVYLFELDKDQNVVLTKVEEISLAAPREPLPGDSDEEPVVLVEGWNEPIAAAKVGADEEGLAHFTYTAEKAGMFVFSCGYEIKKFDAECGLIAIEAPRVMKAYGKPVKAGEKVVFSAYLPQSYVGVEDDELYNVDEYMFYATVIEDDSEPAVAPELTDGTYYIQNTASGQFLQNGAYWGTRAVLGTSGLLYKVTKGEDGKYTLVSDVKKAGNALRPSDGFNDQSGAWTIESVAGGFYMKNDDNKYFCNDGTGVPQLVEAANDSCLWLFVTEEMRAAALAEEMAYASAENPVDVSYLIKKADFMMNDPRPAAWEGGEILGGDGGSGCAIVNSGNSEKWNAGNFDVNQTITGLPAGNYKLTVRAFYRHGSDGKTTDAADAYENGTEVLPYLYAGTDSVAIKSVFAEAEEAANGGWAAEFSSSTKKYFIPNNQGNADACFAAGAYLNTLEGIKVGVDGKLKIGVCRTGEAVYEWTVFDQFTLTYLGLSELAIETQYNEGSTQCTLTAKASSDKSVILYSTDNGEEFMMAENGVFNLAYTPGMADQFSVCTFNVIVREVVMNDEGEILEILAQGFEQVRLAKPNDEVATAGASADNAIALVEGNNEPIAAATVGKDEEGATWFTFTAEKDGLFVFSCTPGKAMLPAESDLKEIEDAAVRGTAYGKSVKAGETINFAIILPAVYEGVAFDENGEEKEGETELYDITEYYVTTMILEEQACEYVAVAYTAKDEEWEPSYTDGARLVNGALNVEVYNGYVVIKNFDGVEGYDLKVAFDAEANVTAVEPLGLASLNEGWIWSGKEYWSPVLSDKGVVYSFAGLEEDGKSGYVCLSVWVGDAYVYYNVVWGVNIPEAISNIKAAVAEGEVYDLAGRRVSNAKKGGLYIVNGKKVRF